MVWINPDSVTSSQALVCTYIATQSYCIVNDKSVQFNGEGRMTRSTFLPPNDNRSVSTLPNLLALILVSFNCHRCLCIKIFPNTFKMFRMFRPVAQSWQLIGDFQLQSKLHLLTNSMAWMIHGGIRHFVVERTVLQQASKCRVWIWLRFCWHFRHFIQVQFVFQSGKAGALVDGGANQPKIHSNCCVQLRRIANCSRSVISR